MSNFVFIAASLDGYIADSKGGLDWLNEESNPDHIDCGYSQFMESVDAIVMGRTTFEAVCNFDCEWPYHKPVFVCSSTLTEVDNAYSNKAQVVSGTPIEITKLLAQKGYAKLYIDGGVTIQRFLQASLIDELTITIMPILLGGGTKLFGVLENPLRFQLVNSCRLLNNLVQVHYKLIS